MTSSLKDRLRGHETTESLWDEAEAVAEDLAEEHYNRCYDGEVCQSCLREVHSPDMHRWGPLSDMNDELEELIASAEARFDEIDGETEQAGPVIHGRYLDYFHERPVNPVDCTVCTAEIVDQDVPCGHWEMQEPCPVRGGLPD